MNKLILYVLRILTVLSVPVILGAGFIGLLLTPVYVQLEYKMPNFPPDRYGFSQTERLRYADLTRSYLVSGVSMQELQELSFDDGEPLFNQRELSHLQDVKDVLQGLFWASGLAVVMLAGSGIWSYRKGEGKLFKSFIQTGSWLTIGLLLFVLTFSLLSFQSFFFKFHGIFFEGDTWLFHNSDTLIRLFPLRFWRDAFIVFGLFTLGGGGLLAWMFREKS